jgi:hypothetical protein
VLLPCAMSNHYHAVIYDRVGRYPRETGETGTRLISKARISGEVSRADTDTVQVTSVGRCTG